MNRHHLLVATFFPLCPEHITRFPPAAVFFKPFQDGWITTSVSNTPNTADGTSHDGALSFLWCLWLFFEVAVVTPFIVVSSY